MLRNIDVFPVEFTRVEQAQTMALLHDATNASKTYSGNYQSSWLLSSLESTVWKISKGFETRNVGGVVTGFYEYDWSAMLCDGTNLTDPANKSALLGFQRLAFLARELPGGPDTLSTFKNFLWSLNFLIRWCFLHADVLDPRRYLLTKLEQHHFIDLFTELGKGGTAFALRYPERFLIGIFPLALGRQPTMAELSNPLSIDLEDCKTVQRWLKSCGEMERVVRSENAWSVKRSAIARAIGVDAKVVRGGHRWRAFLQQFEVRENVGDNGADTTGLRRACKSQKYITSDAMRDTGAKEKTLHKYYDDLKHIVFLHKQLPGVCPRPNQFNPKKLRRLMVELSELSAHTPWIPLDIALTYTTESLKWVHVYGEDLVTLFLTAYSELNVQNLLISAPKPLKSNPTNADFVAAAKALTAAREKLVGALEIPSSLLPLNLHGWGNHVHLDGSKAFRQLKDNPSLLDALMVLVGAITVVVATMKPIRESEFRALKRECLLFVNGDGYWLSQDVRKKNVGDVRPIDARPIPVIAAKALQLLRRLTDGLKEIIGVTDPWLQESLLTLPSFGRYDASLDGVVTTHQLNSILDAFCDHVAIPVDGEGRRWYLRIHEMRKSFLITFFWMYRYSSLDAARWVAGHSNPEHLYAYIQANFPGEELPGLEAEYASQLLRDYDKNSSASGVKDLDFLHREVCRRFSVKDLSLIDAEMLRDWLELQFSTGDFEILPYTIRGFDGGVSTEVGLRVKRT